MDTYMDHALVCSCGGDRTLRHNAIRDDLFAEAGDVGVRAEREKQGLLPPRPGDEVLKGEHQVRGRRPADIWIAPWESHSAAALDFAVTSGLRSDRIVGAAQNCESVWGQCETFKRGYLDTIRCPNSLLLFGIFNRGYSGPIEATRSSTSHGRP